MPKRRKPPTPPSPNASLPFDGYDLASSRPVRARSTGRKRSAPPDTSPLPVRPRACDSSGIPDTGEAQPAGPQRGVRPTPPGAPADRLRVGELLSLPARAVTALPAPVTMLLEACVTPAGSVLVVATTCEQDYERAGASGVVRLHGAELGALVLSAELERLTCAALTQWVASKQATPSWEFTPHVTLGAAVNGGDRLALRWSSVLHACGATMVAVAAAAPAEPAFWELVHGTLDASRADRAVARGT